MSGGSVNMRATRLGWGFLTLSLLCSGAHEVMGAPLNPAAPNKQTQAAVTSPKGPDSSDFATKVADLQTLASQLSAYCSGNKVELLERARASVAKIEKDKATESKPEKDKGAEAKAAENKAAVEKVKNAPPPVSPKPGTGGGSEPPPLPAPPKDPVVDAGPSLCKRFIGPDASLLDLGPFSNQELSTIAVAIDPSTVGKIATEVDAQLSSFKVDKLSEVEARSGGPLLSAAKAANGLQRQLNSGGFGDLESYATNLLATGLEGLAKLIVDRARFEASGWFLDSVGKQLCKADGKDPVLAKEMSSYWLPAVCDLSSHDQLWEYGAGSALWQSVQTAAKKDLLGFPGNGVGLAIAALYLSDAPAAKSDPPAKEPPTPFDCDVTDAAQNRCISASKLRAATLQAALRIQAGQRATGVLEDWSGDLTKLNADGGSDRLQKLACLVSIPGFVAAHGEQFAQVLDKRSAPRVLVLAALTSEQACLAAKAPLPFALGRATSCDYSKATCDNATESSDSELLTNLAAKKPLLAFGGDVQVAVRRVQEAIAALDLVAIDPSTSSLGEKADAVFEVADATIGLAVAAVDTANELDKQANNGANGKAYAEIKSRLAQIRDFIATGRAFAKEDWSAAASTAGSLVANVTTDTKLSDHFEAKRRDIAVLVAILTAKNGDDMAKAIGSLADPPGAWRTKQRPGTHMLSITAEAGWYGGAELRFGNYGVIKESGKPVYAQPPTLALPVGLEYTYGARYGSVGLFFPILDPAAFLTYDVSHGARLPGPSVFTALCPGIAFKWGIPTTPISVLPFVFVRPGFRQWKPDADGFGATALQAGLMLGVDATLFSLASWTESKEAPKDVTKEKNAEKGAAK